MQEQLQYFYKDRKSNMLNIEIKTELPDKSEDDVFFIYVDDLDHDYDPSSVAPFPIAHVPIKEELQEATVPEECDGPEHMELETAAQNLSSNYLQIKPPPPPSPSSNLDIQPSASQEQPVSSRIVFSMNPSAAATAKPNSGNSTCLG